MDLFRLRFIVFLWYFFLWGVNFYAVCLCGVVDESTAVKPSARQVSRCQSCMLNVKPKTSWSHGHEERATWATWYAPPLFLQCLLLHFYYERLYLFGNLFFYLCYASSTHSRATKAVRCACCGTQEEPKSKIFLTLFRFYDGKLYFFFEWKKDAR